MTKEARELTAVDDIVDPETGEVVELLTPSQLAAVSGMTTKRMLEIIRAGNAAPLEAFAEREMDFWSPEESEEEIRGIYLGYIVLDQDTKNPRRQHMFGTESKREPGKPHVIRMSGSAALNSILNEFPKGTFLMVQYLGKKGTVAGFQAKMWNVREFKA